jgi:hypothetical protein
VLNNYGAVVIVCGIYATRLSLAGYLERNWEVLKAKQVAFVSVAGSPADNIFSTKAYSRIPESIRSKIAHFHLAGGSGSSPLVKKDNIHPMVEFLKAL